MKEVHHFTITDVEESHPSLTDLSRLGFLPERHIKIAGAAPWGDPIMVALHDRWFALRKNELSALHLKEDS